ncbi:MAG: FAD-binding protein, partial [Bacteroidetes bacterium]|nr:FAD-binding protein [Bacteroidota bacterium]
SAFERYGKIEANVHHIENPTKEQVLELGKKVVSAKYGNLFDMYENIVGENPYEHPMKIYPAVHYTMGGLWVDYNLQSTIPGMYVLGEANFSDHGANRLGASALMQGLADGYFVIPYTIADQLAGEIRTGPIKTDTPEFDEAEKHVRGRIEQLLNTKGTEPVDHFHKRLGKVMWEYCGMARNAAGLQKGIEEIRKIRDDFWKNVRVPGKADEFNQELEKAGRVADFLELGELMCKDALHRNESCGGHFREEYQTEEGEALRDDNNFAYVGAWEWKGDPGAAELHKEALKFTVLQLSQRSYK